MEKIINDFKLFLNEYWGSSAPGTVIVPGDWYKDSVSSRNYKPSNTNMPFVIDPVLEDSDFISIFDDLREDEDLLDKIKGSEDPLKIINMIENAIKSKRFK